MWFQFCCTLRFCAKKMWKKTTNLSIIFTILQIEEKLRVGIDIKLKPRLNARCKYWLDALWWHWFDQEVCPGSQRDWIPARRNCILSNIKHSLLKHPKDTLRTQYDIQLRKQKSLLSLSKERNGPPRNPTEISHYPDNVSRYRSHVNTRCQLHLRDWRSWYQTRVGGGKKEKRKTSYVQLRKWYTSEPGEFHDEVMNLGETKGARERKQNCKW